MYYKNTKKVMKFIIVYAEQKNETIVILKI